MLHNQKGFTLPELLIGLAISSIIIAASFGSYIVIKNNYDFQKDMKNISQSSRAVATMIMRDVRLAGYNFDDGPGKQNPEITSPVNITDGGSTGPDSIEVIYDQSFTERLKISYYSKPYPNTNSQRSRLYKKVERCDPSVNCSAGSLVTVIPESPIADYVEDFQLIGTKGSCSTSSGKPVYGCGNYGPLVPIKGEFYSTTNGKCNKDPMLAVDGNTNTPYFCSTANGDFWTSNQVYLKYTFANPVRLIEVTGSGHALLDGGSYSGTFNVGSGHNGQAIYPAGKDHNIESEISLIWYGGSPGTGHECAWHDAAECKKWVSSGSNLYLGYLHFPPTAASLDVTTITQGMNSRTDIGFKMVAGKVLFVHFTQGKNCKYTGPGQNCNAGNNTSYQDVPELSFVGESYGGAMNPQEIEISLLIRSPEQHGSTPRSQTWTIGNRTINTNDNYIRDAYSISALIRNAFYAK